MTLYFSLIKDLISDNFSLTPESIYSSQTAFKLNSSAATTIPLDVIDDTTDPDTYTTNVDDAELEIKHVLKTYMPYSAKYKKENQPLTNLTDGGENPPALSGEKNGMYGKTHTDEVKKKLHDCNPNVS